MRNSLQSGLASIAERVTARTLGEQPKLRVVQARNPFDVLPSEPVLQMQVVDLLAPGRS
jgi:hypothetical protein